MVLIADFVQLPLDGTGKKLDTASEDLDDGRGTVHKQRIWVQGEVADGSNLTAANRPISIGVKSLGGKLRWPSSVPLWSTQQALLVAPIAADWFEVVTGSANAIATATHTAVANERHLITAAAASFTGGAPTSSITFQIKRGTTVIWQIAILGAMSFNFAIPLDGLSGDVSGVLGAAGIGINGVVSLAGLGYVENV